MGLEKFLQSVEASIAQQTLVHLVLSKPNPLENEDIEKCMIRPLSLRGALHYQFSSQRGKQQLHQNFLPEDAFQQISSDFGKRFHDAHLFTTEADVVAQIKAGGKLIVRTLPPSKQPKTLEHNRSKQYLIPANQPCGFLEKIGVMNAAGKVYASHQHKFKQINRFLELIDDVVDTLPQVETLRIVDFGCGKSYLTFALHHLLVNIRKKKVRIMGIDRNPDVIQTCSRVARELGCPGLEFGLGDICEFQPDGEVHLVVSLHACDTATDDALAQSVRWNAHTMLLVPCCQHEIARKLDPDKLPLLHKHGILKERWAALTTDALRAQVLEILGYRTQVIEFIDMEHTPKNVMIRAIRRPLDREGFASHISLRAGLVEAYQQCKQMLGLSDLYLETVLEPYLSHQATAIFPVSQTEEITHEPL